MGRPEKPLSTADGPIAQIAIDLRQMRAAAGLTYRAMGEKAHYSHTSLSRAVKGERLPSWETTQAFVRACGASDEEVHEWRLRWVSARTQLRSSTDEAAPDTSFDPAVTSPPNSVHIVVHSSDIAPADAAPTSSTRSIARSIARKMTVANLLTTVLALLITAMTVLVTISPPDELPADSTHDYVDGGGSSADVNAETRPRVLMLTEIDPESGVWDLIHRGPRDGARATAQIANVTACSPPRTVSYALPPGVKRLSFTVELGAATSPGLAVAVKITVDDAAVFSQPIQANISYTVDAGSLTDPQRLTIEWATASGNNGTGNNCEPHGSLVLNDAKLYR